MPRRRAYASWSSDDEDDDEDDDVIGFAGLAVVGAEMARIARAERRFETRQYLSRAQLLPDPMGETPWQRLYASREDRAFITTMGVDCNTFDYILESGFSDLWASHAIPRSDTNPHGFPRLTRRSLTAPGALGLALHYVSSTMSDTALQEIFALVPSTVTRYRSFALDILLKTLRLLPEGTISWPKNGDYEYDNSLIRARHPLLVGAFGSIDGLNLPVSESDDPEIENASYNGWLHAHFVSCVLVFSPRGTVIQAILNAPGSWHDAKIARPIYDKLRDSTPAQYYLVADTAFPRGTRDVEGRIRAPLKSGQRVPRGEAAREEVLAFNRQLLSYRQTAEWGMRQMQGGFARLRVPLDINNPAGRRDLLEVCVRLNNVRATRVGISQIRSVYEPIWREADGAELWEAFEQLLFSEIRGRDRVSKYYLEVVE